MTVSLDEETARWARVEAARSDTSLSRFVDGILRQQMAATTDYERARRSYLSRKPVPLGATGQPYPERGELHDR